MSSPLLPAFWRRFCLVLFQIKSLWIASYRNLDSPVPLPRGILLWVWRPKSKFLSTRVTFCLRTYFLQPVSQLLYRHIVMVRRKKPEFITGSQQPLHFAADPEEHLLITFDTYTIVLKVKLVTQTFTLLLFWAKNILNCPDRLALRIAPTCMWGEQDVIAWSRRVISIVACCQGMRL